MGLFDGTLLERPILCERCGADVKVCQCEPIDEIAAEAEVAPDKQRLKVRVEKRKRGKVVTVIAGFTGTMSQRQHVLTQLKNHCGAGGTIDEGQLEIQGDQAHRVRKPLENLGFKIT